MDKNAESKVKAFYETEGWSKNKEGQSKDAELWEDLRPCAQTYVSDCRKRIALALKAESGQRILDAASGPIQYDEYLEFSQKFEKRFCVDIAQSALDQAEKRIGDHGEFVRCSILELPFPDNHFDAVISLHTIYHIDKDQQEQAMRQLIRVAKPGKKIIVIYANPNRILARLKRWITGQANTPSEDHELLYYFAHELAWWNRFSDQCNITLSPWRSITAQDGRRFIPDNFLGKFLLQLLFRWESTFSAWATSWGAYPMIQLTKK